MQKLDEPTDEALEAAKNRLGTFYFRCDLDDLRPLRGKLHALTKGTGVSLHTSYNTRRCYLRVVFSRGT